MLDNPPQAWRQFFRFLSASGNQALRHAASHRSAPVSNTDASRRQKYTAAASNPLTKHDMLRRVIFV
jgi:hypothetical protein